MWSGCTQHRATAVQYDLKAIDVAVAWRSRLAHDRSITGPCLSGWIYTAGSWLWAAFLSCWYCSFNSMQTVSYHTNFSPVSDQYSTDFFPLTSLPDCDSMRLLTAFSTRTNSEASLFYYYFFSVNGTCWADGSWHISSHDQVSHWTKLPIQSFIQSLNERPLLKEPASLPFPLKLNHYISWTPREQWRIYTITCYRKDCF